MRVIILAALLAGCSSSSSNVAPTQCAKSDRHGTYLLTYATVSGNCGDIPSILVDFDTADAGGGCKLNSGAWSNGDCKYEADETCPLNPGSLRIVEVTSEAEQGAAKLTGTATFTASGSNQDCAGTYNVTAVRQ